MLLIKTWNVSFYEVLADYAYILSAFKTYGLSAAARHKSRVNTVVVLAGCAEGSLYNVVVSWVEVKNNSVADSCVCSVWLVCQRTIAHYDFVGGGGR